jgi:hypothetical protein
MMPNNYRTESLDIYVGIMIFPQVTSAFLLINIEFLLGDDVMMKLKNMPEIVDVYRVQGMYDIRKVEGITGTVTIMIAQGKV